MILASARRSLLGLEPFSDRSPKELWYLQSAKRWLEALPIGNGRFGGMIFGGVDLERMALSESTAWSGAPRLDDVNPEALPNLAEIRQLLVADRYSEARKLCQRFLLAHPTSFGTNLPLPELLFSFENSGPSTAYRRSLDLDQAVARISYRSNGVLCSRECFASHPDKVIAAHCTCAPGQGVTFRASFANSVIPAKVTSERNDTLVLRGRAYEKLHSDGSQGVSLQIRIIVMSEGGQVSSTDQALEVRNARPATVLIAAATDYRGGDPDVICRQQLSQAAQKRYSQLRTDHIADHQKLYRRVSLELGTNGNPVAIQPTDVRRRALSAGANDPELVALFSNMAGISLSPDRARTYHCHLPCRGFGMMDWQAPWGGLTTSTSISIHNRITGLLKFATCPSARFRSLGLSTVSASPAVVPPSRCTARPAGFATP